MEKNTQEKSEKKVAITNAKVEQLSRQPILETQVSKSQNGKWIIHKTIITDLKPVAYFEKILS